MKFDLHLHTTASDGTDSPAQLAELAAQSGFDLIAVTDHDTVSGVEEAQETGRTLGVRVIPGVEISAGGEPEVHVLGYGMRDLATMEQELGRMRELRDQRMEQMIERLRQAGVDVDIERVRELSGGGSMGRPHLARALVEEGKVRDVREAFYRFLSPGRPGYVARHKLTVTEAVRLIRDCGGLPGIAHPGQNKGGEFWLPERLSALKEEGLCCLEVYHMSHSKAQCQAFDRMARQIGLLVTGGSDYHGSVKKVRLGDGMHFWTRREEDIGLFLKHLD